MNSTLLLCERCLAIQGCTDPTRKSCRSCTTHDCPILPAPQATVVSCAACAAREHPTVPPRRRAHRYEPAPAWLS